MICVHLLIGIELLLEPYKIRTMPMRRIHGPHGGTVTIWFKDGDDDDHGDSLIFCRNFFMLPTVTRAGCRMCAFPPARKLFCFLIIRIIQSFMVSKKIPNPSSIQSSLVGACSSDDYYNIGSMFF